MLPNGTPEIKDFSRSLEPKKFKVNDDVFLAVPDIPLGLASMLGKLRVDTADADAMERMLAFFDEVLLDESAARFRARCSSKTEPIALPQAQPILEWMMEEYGMRPTPPSADSSSTSADGTSTLSTAGVSLEG